MSYLKVAREPKEESTRAKRGEHKRGRRIRAGGQARPHVHIPFVLASFGSLVLSYVTTASGGAASPGLGGQRTPRGKGKGKDMGFEITSGLTRIGKVRFLENKNQKA